MKVDWIYMLPGPWELAGLKWHVFIRYNSDFVRVIDLHDVLVARGYRVVHEKHTSVTPEN